MRIEDIGLVQRITSEVFCLLYTFLCIMCLLVVPSNGQHNFRFTIQSDMRIFLIVVLVFAGIIDTIYKRAWLTSCHWGLLYTFLFLTHRVTLNDMAPQVLHTLSNSSMRHMPLSASTRAPASNVHSLVTGCLCT